MNRSKALAHTTALIAECYATASDGTRPKRYSNPSDSILERSNNAIIAANIEHSAVLPLDRHPATSQLPASDRSISIAADR